MQTLNRIVCLADLQRHAIKTLPKMVWDYYRSGANAEITLAENELAFQRYHILPRVLRSVGTVSLATSIQGHAISMPICVAPTAMHCMAHPDGEKATARAAMTLDTCMCLSTLSTTSLEDVARVDPANKGIRWFQLYIYTDRDATLQLVRRAEQNNYRALAVTVDAPPLGMRYSDERNKFSLPPHLTLANFDSKDLEKAKVKGKLGSGLSEYFSSLLDDSLSWDSIEWLKSITSLPIIVKGIQTAEDAVLAVEHGVDGIWVSNHGARQLDTVPATIDILYEVVQAVDPKHTEIYMDGGVHYGTDVLKALALGARAVFVGRPALWGLAYDGEKGVVLMLELLRKELEMAMKLSGCKDVLISNDVILRSSSH